METQKFDIKISILPQSLTSNYIQEIHEYINSNVLNVVSKNHGYILSYRDLEVVSNVVKRGIVVFHIAFNADCLIPRVDSVMTGTVAILNQLGIFIDVCGRLKILVNKNTLVGYEFREVRESRDCRMLMYMHAESGKSIRIGDTLNIRIKMVKYENGMYKCFGTVE